MDYDAIVVGGGPAGLSAALVLGRCRRSVLVIDAGRPRNHAALKINGYLSRDGISPERFASAARDELAPYDVTLVRDVVTAARCIDGGFHVRTARDRSRTGRVLLLATGVRDELPPISNAADFYGRGLHHCPYCDAWEHRGERLAAYGQSDGGFGLARSLRTWSRSVTVLLDGRAPTSRQLREARRLGVHIMRARIDKLVSRRGMEHASLGDHLASVVFRNGRHVDIDAIFFSTEHPQRSDLPRMLGCAINTEGGVVHDKKQRTGIPGLYLAGDASADVQFVIVAAAEGAKAAVAINHDLQERETRWVLLSGSVDGNGSGNHRPNLGTEGGGASVRRRVRDPGSL